MTGRKTAAMKSLVLLGGLGLGLASCSAEAPRSVIDQATVALEQARSANEKGYAPEALDKAEEAYAAAMAEVETQADRLFLMRSYGTASELLGQATAAAKEAKEQAEARREEMQAESDTLIKDVQKRFESAEIVAEESRQPDAKATLEKAGAALFEAEKAFKAGDFLAAYEKAQDAQAFVEALMTEASPAKRGET